MAEACGAHDANSKRTPAHGAVACEGNMMMFKMGLSKKFFTNKIDGAKVCEARCDVDEASESLTPQD